ncbi:UNVERIFIED_CONTAM: HAUS augmin-like complex subunit 6 [Siphonaria sp. JEL0065]|nr:HAUS augmin-like complex subunit 6 [Siphonaria sp. JEL0065]
MSSNAIRQSVFSALNLLGFEAAAGVAVDTLFSKGVASANPKAFEAVAYFLLCQSGCRCVDAEVFRHCFPVCDRAQAREFRAAVAKALETLKKAGALPAALQIRRSFFDEQKGERFEHALLALSTHVLSCTMHADYSLSLPEQVANPTSATLLDIQSAIDDLSAKFIADTAVRDKETKDWIEYGSWLSDEFRRSLVDLEKLSVIKQEMESNPVFVDGEGVSDFKELIALHEKKLGSVRSLWKDCLHWIETNRDNMDLISSVMHNRANIHTIDGSDSRLEIPNELSEQFRKEIQAERIVPYTEDGMLELVSTVKLLGVSVKNVDETLQGTVFQNEHVLDEKIVNMKEQVDILKGIHSNSKAVRKQLVQKHEDLDSSVRQLKSERQQRENVENVEPTKPVILTKALKDNSSMTLAPVTPKLHIRDRISRTSNASHFKYPALPDGFMAATPDAVNLIRANVRSKLQKDESLHDLEAAHPEKPILSLKQPAKKAIYTPKHFTAPDTPLAAVLKADDSIFGKTPSKGSLSAAPDSSLKLKASGKLQSYPTRKKPSTASQLQKPKSIVSNTSIVSTPVKSASAAVAVKAKGKSLPVNHEDAVVDQIVQSIAMAASENKVRNTERKTVRFNDLSKDPFSALGTTGFQPRAEIARTPLKGSIRNTPLASNSNSKLPSQSKPSTPVSGNTPLASNSNSKLPSQSKPSTPVSVPNVSTPSLVKSVLKSNMTGAIGTSASGLVSSASPSRLANPSKNIKGTRSLVVSSSMRDTATNDSAKISAENDESHQAPSDWLHSLDESNNLLDEDIPDFMAREYPLAEDASMLEFPSYPAPLPTHDDLLEQIEESHQSLNQQKHLEPILKALPDQFEVSYHSLPSSIMNIEETLPTSTVALDRPSSVNTSGSCPRSDIFQNMSMANPLDEMSICRPQPSYCVDGEEGADNQGDEYDIFSSSSKFLLPAMKKSSLFTRTGAPEMRGNGCGDFSFMDSNNGVVGGNKELINDADFGDDCDDLSIMGELPPEAVANSEGDGEDLDGAMEFGEDDVFDSGVVEGELEYDAMYRLGNEFLECETPTTSGRFGLVREDVVATKAADSPPLAPVSMTTPSTAEVENVDASFTSVLPFEDSKLVAGNHDQSQIMDDTRIIEMVLANAAEMQVTPSLLGALAEVDANAFLGTSTEIEPLLEQQPRQVLEGEEEEVVFGADIALSSIRLSNSVVLSDEHVDHGEDEPQLDHTSDGATNDTFSSIQFSRISIPAKRDHDDDDVDDVDAEALEEAAVSSIHLSKSDEDEKTPLKPKNNTCSVLGNILTDSFVVWDTQDGGLQPLQNFPTPGPTELNQASAYLAATDDKFDDAEEDEGMDEIISLQTFDASVLPIVHIDTSPANALNALNLLDEVDDLVLGSDQEMEDASGFVSCKDHIASMVQIPAGHQTAVGELSTNIHPEVTSSFDRYAKSAHAQKSMSTLRLDSGVADGPEDLSEIPPGHPEPSHILLASSSLNESGALSLSMLEGNNSVAGSAVGLEQEPSFPVLSAVTALAAEADAYSQYGQSGELKLDDIEGGEDEGASQRLFSRHDEVVPGSDVGGKLLDGFLDWNKEKSGEFDYALGVDESGLLAEKSLGWLDDDRGFLAENEPSFLAEGDDNLLLEDEDEDEEEEEHDL